MSVTKEFEKNVYYENIIDIMSPHGFVEKGMIFSGEEWENILVYGVGNCGIEGIFIKTKKPKK